MSYARGVNYLLLAGVFLSTTGIFVRLIENASPWVILFYRSIAFFLLVLVFSYFTTQDSLLDRYRRFSVSDLVISLSLGAGFIFYLLSVYYTTVANTVVLLSTGPLFAALLGWCVLRERVSRVTWFAMLLAGVGVLIMFGQDLSGTHTEGMFFALASVLSFAFMVVALRSGDQNEEKLPATAVAGLVAALCTLPFVDSLAISFWDLLMALGLGVFQVGIGFILVTLGARTVPSAQVPLFALTETALAPIWVWMLVNEVPASATLIGGGVVIVAVIVQGVVGLRTHRVAL